MSDTQIHLEEENLMTDFDASNLPPMNGTLARLYHLANLPLVEIRKPNQLANAIKEMATIHVYLYTLIHENTTRTADISKNLTLILSQITTLQAQVQSVQDIKIEKEVKAPEKNNFDKVVAYLVDKVLPYFIIAVIYFLIQMMIQQSNVITTP